MNKIVLLCAVLGCIHFSEAQSILLDPSFGTKGIIKMDMGSAFKYLSSAKQVLLQTDGSFYLNTEYNGLTVIIKKSATGTPDSSYGINGASVTLPIQSYQAALQKDGKLVVVGYTLDNDYRGGYDTKDFAVIRLNTNGTLDSSFDGDGVMILDFGEIEGATAVVIQNDGKIVVAGGEFTHNRGQQMVIVRLNTDGSLDADFGIGGIQSSGFADNDYANAVVLQSDGKILVGGYFLWRYNPNGLPDSSFNNNGRQSIPGFTSSIGIQQDGKIIVATNASNKDSVVIDFGLSRYNISGSVDSSFGENGLQTLDLGHTTQIASAVAIQSDGKIVLAGYTGDSSQLDFAIVRYNKNGGLDNSFLGMEW